ncbi:MAG TPA: helix-turn-helix domain-containing protein, partial [Spirochaetia bacterium]|nr:helix-turn-helix domain-containing protein [Spirochaetia bacterium]
MNGQREEIINLLTQLGLTEYESRVYLSLLEKHPSSAYGISQVSGVPHSRVYDIARRLMRKGLIQSAGTNPARFSPLAPEELIARLTRERERIITDLGGRLESYAFEGEPEPVWNIPVRFEALDT